MKKRDKGIINNALALVITIIFMCIIVLGFIYFSNWITVKNNIDATCRKYMLRMETDGYLDSQNRAELIAELSGYGVTDINMSGTTTTETSYGTRIILRVQGTIHLDGVDLGGGGSVTKTFDFPIDIRKESVSKN